LVKEEKRLDAMREHERVDGKVPLVAITCSFHFSDQVDMRLIYEMLMMMIVLLISCLEYNLVCVIKCCVTSPLVSMFDVKGRDDVDLSIASFCFACAIPFNVD